MHLRVSSWIKFWGLDKLVRSMMEVQANGGSELRVIRSGEWEAQPAVEDYRAEWLSNLLVERADWREDAAPLELDGTQIGGPEGVWFRFWLPEPQQIIDKYFDDKGRSIGIYIPIVDTFQFDGEQYHTTHLILGLWLTTSGHVTVIGEAEFDAAIHLGVLSEGQVRWAETRIREVTADVSRSRLPPPLIRNFSLEKHNSTETRGDP